MMKYGLRKQLDYRIHQCDVVLEDDKLLTDTKAGEYCSTEEFASEYSNEP